MTVLINGVEYVPAFRPKPVAELGTFGNALRMARKQNRLSLDKAAALVGCSKSFLWEPEKDKAEPGLKLAYRLSDAYGIPLLVLALLAQAEPVALPHPGSPEASAMIDSVLAEYQWPTNAKNAARAGYVAAKRMLCDASSNPPAQHKDAG